VAAFIAFIAGTHEAILRELRIACLSESAADLEQEFGFVYDIPADGRGNPKEAPFLESRRSGGVGPDWIPS
jgi:hypothetical protein